LHLKPGERALHLGAHDALVEQPDGHRYVAQSTGTLSYDSPQGRVPVSLALKDRGSDVGPEHSPADVGFPKKGSDRFFFSGGGFGVSVDGAQPASAQMQGGKLFYPNALPDTDVLAVPTPTGLDTYGVIRSANGPEALVLRFDLPAGGALVERLDPEGTTVGLTRDGQPLASIAPPQAQDAQGVPVPVSYKVEGSRLVVRVTHRSKGYAYPIMIDPSITESAHWRQDNSSDYNGFADDTAHTAGWASFDHGLGQESPSNPSIWHGGIGFPLESSTDNVYGPNGLYFETEPAPNGLYYHTWQTTAYHYQAPGDAYIYQAQFGYHNAHIAYGNPPVASAATPNDSCLYEGIYSPSRGAWEGAWFEQNWEMAYQAPAYAQNQGYANQPREMCQFTHADNWLTCGYGCQPANQSGTGPALTPGNEISIGMFARRDGVPSSSNPNLEDFAYSGSVDWQESDMGRPSFDPSTLPQSDPQWVGDVTRSLSPTATDGGLGVKTAELSTPNTSGGTTVARSDVSCYGNRDYRCPQRITFDNSTPYYYAAQPLTYNTANMPEGINTLGLAAVDVVGNASAGTSANPDFTANQWTVKVDRTPPTIGLSGALYDQRGATITGDANLHVAASDGDGSTPSSARSGVKSIDVSVDGVQKDHVDQACAAGSCALARDWAFRGDQYGEGDRTINVVATDQLGHQSTQSFTIHNHHVRQFGILPYFQLNDFTLNDRMDAHVNVANGNLVVHESDLGIAGTAGLNLKVDRYYNSTSTDTRDLGYGWVMGTGADVRLHVDDNGSVAFYGPEGYKADFENKGLGVYKPPGGVHALLVTSTSPPTPGCANDTSASYTLCFYDRKQNYLFDGNGRLTAEKDRNGHKVSFDYDSNGRLSDIVDSQGRKTTFVT